MDLKEYMKRSEERNKKIISGELSMDELDKLMQIDRKEFEETMKEVREKCRIFSLKNWFPELKDVPIPWLIIGIVSLLFCFLGMLL